MPQRAPDGGSRLIGWREYVALPEWGIVRIKAKADTGARSSAIDVSDLQRTGAGKVRFEVIASRRQPAKRVRVEAQILRETTVRSSLGETHTRIVVATRLRIGTVEKVVELGLVSRPMMRCRMLLGRTALTPEFRVDPGRSFVLSRARRRSDNRRANAGRVREQEGSV